MSSNIYRVGDYVYFESCLSSPFLIRRIEELNKTQTGLVEAKAMCFYRRRDLPHSLIQLADKHQLAASDESPLAAKLKKNCLRMPAGEEQPIQAVSDSSIAILEEDRTGIMNSFGNNSSEKADLLTLEQRNQIKHRELFLSRQVETLPASNIKGKCSVTLLNETESLKSYLSKDDSFFYCLVFDPNQKTLLADKGEIRVGSRYQCEIPAKLKDIKLDDRDVRCLETLVWYPHHRLNDRIIDQFLVMSRSIGTFARALDCSSSVKQPSLHMSAAAASRDITLFNAMDTLHKHDYLLEDAMCSLIPLEGPILCRDEIEDWSASEANLFEEALEKYGKDFNDIRQDYWYSWGPTHMTCNLCHSCWSYWKKYGGLKNANRMIDSDVDSVKKKVLIPLGIAGLEALAAEQEKINDSSNRQIHRCSIVNCGKDFKLKIHLVRHYAQAHGVALSSNSPRPTMKTRSAFYLHTNPMTKIIRKICSYYIKPKKAARKTSYAINSLLVKQEFNNQSIGKSLEEMKNKIPLHSKDRESVTKIANKLGCPGFGPYEWLVLTPKEKLPKPDVISFPKPPQAPDGSFLYDRIPNKIVQIENDLMMTSKSTNFKKRVPEDLNGSEGRISLKRPNKDPMPSHCPTPEQFAAMMAASGQPLTRHHLNGKPKIAQMARTGSGKKHVISWMDAPDDVYFRANDADRKARKLISAAELRKSARKPWRYLTTIVLSPSRPLSCQVVILD